MKPYYEHAGITLFHGDCREAMAALPDASVDAVVTDPPYGLAFMGKRWDYDVPGVDVWQQVLRVLKPGGHLLAFAGTRTQHRMAVRIEDAGFEIRDMIAWVYGSGFPKSLDVSKAIDKGHGENRERQLMFTAWMRSTGITADQINAATGSRMASHYLTNKEQPAIATADMFDKLRPHLPEVPEEIERLVCERTGLEWTAYQQREVVGRSENGIAGGTGKHVGQDAAYGFAGVFNITAPATPEARQWSGWGTALKPALEPITVARKPLVGTVAANVLEYGTGGINVDGCRVGDNPGYKYAADRNGTTFHGEQGDRIKQTADKKGAEFIESTKGRWPANLIHDGSDEVVGLFPETDGVVGARREGGDKSIFSGGGHTQTNKQSIVGGSKDTGSAARFFYTAKADKADRGHGNNHPTVKPVDLMRYLVRLVCPMGGIVLDPFNGSGTTAVASRAEHCRYIGAELNEDYCRITIERLAQGVLF